MGKLRGKIVKNPDTGKLAVKDTDTKVLYDFDQPFETELGILEKTPVTFELVTYDGKSVGVSVEPVYKGQILTLDYASGTGVLLETETDTKYDFKQNYLKESGFIEGSVVKYTLVNVERKNIAVCLIKVS